MARSAAKAARAILETPGMVLERAKSMLEAIRTVPESARTSPETSRTVVESAFTAVLWRISLSGDRVVFSTCPGLRLRPRHCPVGQADVMVLRVQRHRT